MNMSQLVGSFTIEPDVTPDQGLGSLGEWPPAGANNSIVTSLTVSDEAFRMDGNEYPGFVIQFHYLLADDPTREEPLSWNGAPFRFPKDEAVVTADNQKKRIRIAKERLAGHITTLLGRPQSQQLAADLQAIDTLLSSDSTVMCQVFCKVSSKTREDGTRTEYREEKLQKLLSS